MKAIVLGMGFGDEGKGLTTDYLAKQDPEAIVVRFSGGQQAGHTVVLPDGTKHVFSSFGSGALRGNPTFITKYCTFDPICIINEYDVLVKQGFNPLLSVDPHTPVTTPFEVWANRNDEENIKNGSCGKGIWATQKREADGYSIWACDLNHPMVLAAKMQNLAEYYGVNLVLDRFWECVKRFTQLFDIVPYETTVNPNHVIFEGSQGLLLDQVHGFHPNTTPSNVGLTNIMEITGLDYSELVRTHDVYLVTRAYQTRHGNGFMTNEDRGNNIKPNPHEINVTNDYQGRFRRSILDLDLYKYALERHGINMINVNLVITHLDLVEDAWCFTENGELKQFLNETEFIYGIMNGLSTIGILGYPRTVIGSHSPCSDNYKLLYKDIRNVNRKYFKN